MAPRAMAGAGLLLLALFALAVEGQTKSHPVMFKDFMEAKSGKAKVSDYKDYEESELQGACLRGLTYEKCAFTGTFNHVYFETDVGCCSEGYHKHQDTFRLPEDLKVGRCWWTMDRLIGQPEELEPQDGVTLEGTYEMTCELEKDSEKCGEPFCDDLVLKGWGQIYLDPNAAIQGKPTIVEDNTCTNFFLQRQPAKKTPAMKPAVPAEKPAGKVNPAKIASADHYYKSDDDTQYFLGRARIFTGYVQVVSCSKKVAYKEGKMQAIGNYEIYDEGTAVPIKPSPDQFIAKPYEINLILRKSGDY